MPDGAVLYRHSSGRTYEQHPNDGPIRELLAAQRARRPPLRSVIPRYFELPVLKHRKDFAADGRPLRTPIVPACGVYLDFYDAYGHKYWFNMQTGHVMNDLVALRRPWAAVCIQRIWRGFLVRRDLQALALCSQKIAVWWRTLKFRKVRFEICFRRWVCRC